MKSRFLLLLIAGAALGAHAQTPPPEMPAEEPAPRARDSSPAEQPRESAPVQAPGGTTIIGEQESPIGLYIMPWRISAAESGLDRPARLLDESLMPLDPDVFRRQVNYYNVLTGHLRKDQR
jgi:hypothetical protein